MTCSLELANMHPSANEHDDTPLLPACRACNLKLAKMLVEAGAEVSAANERGGASIGAGENECHNLEACMMR